MPPRDAKIEEFWKSITIDARDKTSLYPSIMKPMMFACIPEIQKVIYNKPATIILWDDGTKTVAKKQKGDRWDPEKGLAMAYLKKILGKKEFYKLFEEYKEE